jgi:hypothetical protein
VIEERVRDSIAIRHASLMMRQYHEPNAEMIDQIVRQNAGRRISAGRSRIPRDLPPYLADLYRTPLLTPPQGGRCSQFNFHKYQFVQSRRRRAAVCPHI